MKGWADYNSKTEAQTTPG